MDFCDSSNPEMNEYLLWTNNARLWVLKSEFAYLGMLSHEASNFYQTRNHKSLYREAKNAMQRDFMRHRFEPMVHGKKIDLKSHCSMASPVKHLFKIIPLVTPLLILISSP